MKLPASLCHLMVVAALTGCGTAAAETPRALFSRSIGKESDTLLRTLAELAREGMPALCNKEYLENKLDIKIDAPRSTIFGEAHVTSAKVSPVSSDVRLSTGRYGTSSNGRASKCYLSIDTKDVFLCNADSTYVKQILRENAEYSVAIGGRSAAGIFYTFKPTSGGMSKVFLGVADEKCVYGFSIFSESVTE